MKFFSAGVATAEEIDAGMRLGANHSIGPLELADLIGLDICLSVLDVFAKDLGDPKYRVCPLLRDVGVVTLMVIETVVSVTGSFGGGLGFIRAVALRSAASYIFELGDVKRIDA